MRKTRRLHVITKIHWQCKIYFWQTLTVNNDHGIILGDANIVVPRCRIHNDATVDISQDGRLIAVHVPDESGLAPGQSIAPYEQEQQLSVYSLEEDTLGQLLYTKSFG